MESRSKPKAKNLPASSGELYYNGLPLKIEDDQSSNAFTRKRQELFICGLGEKGTNEL